MDQFTFLFKNNPLPMWIYDLKTLAFLDVNEAAVEHFGYSHAEFLRMRIPDILTKEDEERVIKHAHAKRPALQHSGKWLHRKKDGSLVYVEVTSHKLNYKDRKAVLVIAEDVTEQQQTHKALERSEEGYRALFENIPDGVYRSTPSGKILAANPALVALLGYESEAELLNVNVRDLYVHRADRKRTMQKIEKDIDLHNEEILLKRRDGQVIIGLENAHAVRDESGKVLYYEGTLSNVTEHKRILEAARLNTERFQVALGTIDIAVFNQDTKLRYTWMYQPQLGYQEEQVRGKTDAELMPAQDAAVIMRIKKGVLKSGTGAREEVAIHTRDQTLFYDLIVEPLRDEKGKIIGLTGATLDITKRKQAEEALRESEARFQSLYENTTVGIYRTTPDGRILMSNPALVKMLGYDSFEELSQRNLEKDGNDADYTRAEFKEQIEYDEAISGHEAVWRTKNGKAVVVRESARVVRDDAGKVLYYEGTVEDITELKKAEEALRASESELRAIFSAIPDLIMVMDRDGYCLKIISSNPEVKYHLMDDFTGKRLHEIFSRQKADQLVKYIRQALKTHKPVQFEYALLADDTIRWFSAIASPLTSNTVVWAARDMTPQKKAEEQTQRRLTELQALYESGLAFSRTMNIKAIGEQIIHILESHLFWHHAAVRLRLEESDELSLIAASAKKNQKGLNIYNTLAKVTPANQGLAGWVVEHNKSLRVSDLSKDARYVETIPNIKSGLYVPMKIGETCIGIISVESEEVDAFDENDERLLNTLASQAAAAIQNARLFDQTQHRAMESATLYELTAELATSRDIDSLLKSLAQDVARLMGVPGGTIYLCDESAGELEIVASTDSHLPFGTRIQFGQGVTGRIAQSHEPMIIDDYLIWEGAALQYKGQPFYSVLGIPMLYGGELIGVFVAHGLHATSTTKERNRKFTERDVRLLSMFASAAAGAVYSARLLESEQKRRQEAEILQKAAAALTSSLNVNQILNALLDELAKLIPSNSATVFIIEGEFIHAVADRGYEDNGILDQKFAIADSMEKYLFESRTPLIIADAHTDPRFHLFNDWVPIRGWMGLPLIVHDTVIGSLALGSDLPNAFDNSQAELAMVIANQAATAIENARLYQDSLRYTRRWVTLHAVSQELAYVSANLEQVYFSIHTAAAKLLSAEVFTIVLADEKLTTLNAVYLFDRGGRSPAMQYPFGKGFSSKVIASGETLKIDDDFERNIEAVYFGTQEAVRSILAVPLRIGDKVIGAMSVQSYEPYAYDTEDRLLLELLATQAAIAIENARLFKESRRRGREFEMLYETTRQISLHQLAETSVLKVLADRAVQLLNAYGSAIYLYDSEHNDLEVFVNSNDEGTVGQRVKIGEGAAGRVAQTRKPLLIDDYRTWEYRTSAAAVLPYRALVTVPMIYGGKLLGVLDVFEYGDSERKFSENDVQLLSLFASHAASAVHNARLFEATRRSAQEFKTLYETSRDISTQQTSDKLLQTIVERAIALLHSKNGGFYLYDAERQELELTFFTEMRLQKGKRLKLGEGAAGRVALTREPLIIDDYRDWQGQSDQYMEAPFRAVLEVPMLYGGELIGVLAVNEHDESERKFTKEDANLLSLFASQASSVVHNARLLAQLEERLEQFSTLHSIDLVIGSTTDLRVSLQVVLESITRLLKIDAADILLYKPTTLSLEYASKVGFSSDTGHPAIRLGEKPAGYVALTRQSVDIPELAKENLPPSFQKMIQQEGFVAYRSLPIIAKGEVKGVLEIYHRSALPSNMEWNDLFNLLAGQAAIAIDNAMLFNNLQHVNAELEIAYDATIESWSQALDFWDSHSDTHIDSMVELTISLAHKLGVSESELPNIRRGVLLHDIGKMELADKILFKAGPLDQDEWEAIKKHPTKAYNLLYKIAYLRPALDIPYCHHEQWDGSGYPRGLREEQIPLAARIFSVVDVYDALSFDRPYRQAWPKDKIIEYIKEQSGKRFDPHVVEAFLQII
jgi:PAS domain S-box-containing protein